MKINFSDEQKQFIRDNFLKMSGNDIGKVFGCSSTPIDRFKKENKLIVPAIVSRGFATAKARGKTRSTPEQDEIIKRDYLHIPSKRLAANLGFSDTLLRSRLKYLKLTIPKEIIEQRKTDSRIKIGTLPPNKGKKQIEFMSAEAIARTAGTRFKKGGKNFNEQFDGAINIRNEHPNRKSGRQIKYIRVAKGKWKELQIYNWEQVNGPIPKGFVLACQDGDTLNCEPENWALLSKADNAKRNAAGYSTSFTLKI